MNLRESLLFLVLLLLSLALLSQGNPPERSNGVFGSTEKDVDDNTDGKVRDILEYSDFDDDDDDDVEDSYSKGIINVIGLNEENTNSVTHLHRERGEILVPCFGMWWPVGGASYDYVGDYYGDYRKKRRRSKKQKKAARTKKKKS